MPPKLAGHVFQLAGYALVFLGLGVAAGAVLLAGSYPGVPLWAFVLVGAPLGVPLMIAGGRVNSIGRGRVLGMSPGEAAREYRLGTALLGVYLAVLLLQGAWVAAPVFLREAGHANPGDPLVLVWVTAWLFIFCAGRYWITHPLLRAAERMLGLKPIHRPKAVAGQPGPVSSPGGDQM
jgi:hypothetical protein